MSKKGPSKKPTSLEFAHHNLAAVEHIRRNDKLGDWQITTAFYTALHFVSHKLFEKPVKQSVSNFEFTFSSFDNFCATMKRVGGEKRAKHEIRLAMAQDQLPTIHPHFERLYNAAFIARYSDYRTTSEMVNAAITDLEKVMTQCSPK